MKILRKYTASDGTQMIIYEDETGYQNTVPQWVFIKLNKSKNNKNNN